jgi:hypothetical protein
LNDRRTALKILVSGAVAFPILAQQHASHEAVTAAVEKYSAKVFSGPELDLLAELTDRIIPRTDTPGAADAGVPLLIDRLASHNPEIATKWKDLLGWFAAQGVTAEARLTVLKTISTESDTAGAKYFRLLKDATIDRYYATKEGLQQELGWHGNTFLPEFPGCTHPEHQISEGKT